MTQYGNLGGRSGVAAFDLGPDSIIVEFRDRAAYLYDYQHTGTTNVETMKSLALGGRGLNTFINKRVQTRYARRLR